MIEQLRAYPNQVSTGLPWVPTAPEHWDLVPNKAHLRIRKVLVGSRHTEYQLLSLTKQGVIVRDISSGKGKFSSDMGTSQEVRSGDIVFCLFDVPETPRTVGLSLHDGMITGAYTVMECRDPKVARFLELFYKAMDDRKLLSPMYSGLRNTIPKNRLLGAKTPIPPPDEQAAIVKFLGHANRKIDRYILAKRKLIKLLEEQKQVIIHRAVTRGLDPNVRMKPSGVEWLGDVPEHWEIWPLKYLCSRIQNGATPPTTEPHHFQNGTIPWFGPSSIGESLMVGQPKKTLAFSAFEKGKARLIQGPAILLIVIGATAGKSALLNSDGSTNQQITAFHLRQALVDPMFAAHQFRLSSDWLRQTASTATLPILSMRLVKRLPVTFPPSREEQVKILSFIKARTAGIDRLLRKAHSGVELLSEYRTRLTADVVTGKLDVREAAAKLPDLASDDDLTEADLDLADQVFEEDDS